MAETDCTAGNVRTGCDVVLLQWELRHCLKILMQGNIGFMTACKSLPSQLESTPCGSVVGLVEGLGSVEEDVDVFQWVL
jgi:hypothetical protein